MCRGDAVSYCRSHRTVPPFIYTQVLSGLLQFNAMGREFLFFFVFFFVLVLGEEALVRVFFLYASHPACFYFRRLPFSSHLHLLLLLLLLLSFFVFAFAPMPAIMSLSFSFVFFLSCADILLNRNSDMPTVRSPASLKKNKKHDPL